MPEREYYYDDQWWLDPPPPPDPSWSTQPPPPTTTAPTTTTTPPTTTAPPSSRHPQAGPDGSTQPNLDPPGYMGGYWMNGQWVQGSPRPSGNPPPPRPTDGGGEIGDVPDYGTLLPYSPYREFAAFQPSQRVFTPTSYEDLENQPGFREGQQRLQKQIEAGAAYRGMLRSGMTLGDLWTGLDTNKAQRFAEFDNRRFRDWSANYGVDRDIYDRGAQENERFNNYRYNTESESFRQALERWRTQVSSITQMATSSP